MKTFKGKTGITLNGVTEPQAFVACRDILITDPNIIGDGTVNAFTFTDCKNVKVLGGNLHQVRNGVVFSRCQNGLVQGVTMDAFSGDGIDFVGSQQMIAAENSFSGRIAIDGKHPDGVQIWTAETGPLAEDILIKSNAFLHNMQGAACFGKPRGAKNVTIEDNFFCLESGHGITLNGVEGGAVRRNVLQTLSTSKIWSTIRLDSGIAREGNRVYGAPWLRKSAVFDKGVSDG